MHGTTFCGGGFFYLWSHVRAQKNSDFEAFLVLHAHPGHVWPVTTLRSRVVKAKWYNLYTSFGLEEAHRCQQSLPLLMYLLIILVTAPVFLQSTACQFLRFASSDFWPLSIPGTQFLTGCPLKICKINIYWKLGVGIKILPSRNSKTATTLGMWPSFWVCLLTYKGKLDPQRILANSSRNLLSKGAHAMAKPFGQNTATFCEQASSLAPVPHPPSQSAVSVFQSCLHCLAPRQSLEGLISLSPKKGLSNVSIHCTK